MPAHTPNGIPYVQPSESLVDFPAASLELATAVDVAVGRLHLKPADTTRAAVGWATHGPSTTFPTAGKWLIRICCRTGTGGANDVAVGVYIAGALVAVPRIEAASLGGSLAAEGIATVTAGQSLQMAIYNLFTSSRVGSYNNLRLTAERYFGVDV